MYRKCLWLILSLAHYAGYSQIAFEPILLPPPAPQISLHDFIGVSSSSMALADVDGDGDQDVFITGSETHRDSDEPVNPVAYLYLNDGKGQYRRVANTSFEAVGFGATAFADIDGDQDLDLLVVGDTSYYNNVAVLYINDGKGNFTKMDNTPFVGTREGAVALADIDGDLDLDVLISGEATTSDVVTHLYTNDGKGAFTRVDNTPFAGVDWGDIAFGDVDGDQDQDVIITGSGSKGDVAALYTNDGKGTFTEQTGTPFSKVRLSSIVLINLDGDQDLDVLITGYDLSGSQNGVWRTSAYINDGQGNFTEDQSIVVETSYESLITSADIDGDQDQDVLMMFEESSNTRIDQYINKGDGTLEKAKSYTLDHFYKDSFSVGDIDSDKDPDIMVMGFQDGYGVELLLNDGTGSLSNIDENLFAGIEDALTASADVNGDSILDVLVIGEDTNEGEATVMLWTEHDQDGPLTEKETSLKGAYNGSIDLADVDQDGDQDVLITGLTSDDSGIELLANLYTNDGKGAFTKVNNTPFTGVAFSAAAFADVNKDDYPDVLITGAYLDDNDVPQVVTKLYMNNQKGGFLLATGTTFTNVTDGTVDFADVDQDGDQDVLITGGKNINSGGETSNPVAELYINNGQAGFTLAANVAITAVLDSRAEWADVNGDNYPDVMISGLDENNKAVTKLYINDQSGKLAEATTGFPSLEEASFGFADVDQDGDQDVLIAAYFEDNDDRITKLYANDGKANFTEVKDLSWVGIKGGTVAWADIDGDQDSDVFILGDNGKKYVSRGYRNVTCEEAPVADVSTLPVLTLDCTDTKPPKAPTATDGCDGKITATTDTQFPITDASVKEITWTYTDSRGKITTQQQAVAVSVFTATITTKGDTLVASPAGATYRWLDCNNNHAVIAGQTAQTFVASQSGSYAVEVTSQESCVDTTECVDRTVLGIVENTFGGEIKAYPNPTIGVMTISLDKPYVQTQVVVRSITGQVVQQQRFGYGQTVSLELTQPKGIYLVSLTSGTHKAVIRVVKQ